MLPWKKKNPIEEQKDEIALLWAQTEVGSDEWRMYQSMYMELDERALEYRRVNSGGSIDARTVLNTATTVGLALLTLNFERFDTLRSKATSFWLRRRDR